MDNIAFYSEDEIKAWWQAFQSAPDDVLIIAGIPFSYYEVRDELLRREHEKDALDY